MIKPHNRTTRYTAFRIMAASLALCVLTACANAPFVDSRREAGEMKTIGESTPDIVAICYSGKATTKDQLLEMAKTECAKTGRTPVFVKQTRYTCRLQTPHHAYYACKNELMRR